MPPQMSSCLTRTLKVSVVIALSALLIILSLSQSSIPAEAAPTPPEARAGEPALANTDNATTTTSVLSVRPICFVSAGQTACVERPLPASVLTDEVRALTRALIAGPTAAEKTQGIQAALPATARLDALIIEAQRLTVELSLPAKELQLLTFEQVEDIDAQFRTTLTPYNFQRIDLKARRTDGVYQPLSKFLKPIELPHKPSPARPPLSTSLSLRGEEGGLSGKTVFLSAGHGWYWNSALNQYRTQRPVYPQPPCTTEGVIEDFNNAEAVNQYLLTYLEQAGADTWTVRERDLNPAMLIADDSHTKFDTAGAWLTGTGGYSGTYRYAVTEAAPTLTATWTFTPATSGWYAVYVRFPNVAVTRTVDAHYFVEQAGAITPITVSQARDADNWRYIGRFPFYGEQAARLWLTNESNTPGSVIMVDALRLGGGLADTPAPDTSVISGKPRWEEQAWTYAKWVGLPNVAAYNDVIVRPIYAEWEKDPGEDAVYIAWHTNGFTGCSDARGTATYIHSYAPTPGSAALQSAIHSEVINAIHSVWDASWPDRGLKAEDYGELRLLDTMPGVLIENGFHDNPIDVEALKDPRFNQLTARAIYHGLVNYWHALDPNVPLSTLPEPPQQVTMQNTAPGEITLHWLPGPIDDGGPLGDVAATYRVYTSADGFGWSNPIEVISTSHVMTGLLANQLIYAKVTGVNAGGESLASPVLGARVTGSGLTPILIVYGYERLDAQQAISQYDAPEGYNRHLWVDRMNRRDYLIQHAEVISQPFDSAQHAAVSSGAIGLGRYRLVDWIAGEEQAPFPVLTHQDQIYLSNYLNAGGALFISGAEIGSELRTTVFYTQTLRAAFLSDTAQTYSVTAEPASLFVGLEPLAFDDGAHGTYAVDRPDSFEPTNKAVKALVYNTGAPAAVEYAAEGCVSLIYLGFPFETVYPRAARQSLMERIVSGLQPCRQPVSQVYLPLIIESEPPPPPCSETLINGDFEAGAFTPGWRPMAVNPPPAIVSGTVSSGHFAARLGALTTTDPITQIAYSSLEQVMSISTDTLTATVSWARYRWSGDVNNFDAQYAIVIDQAGVVHSLITEDVDDPTWNTIAFDLLPYAGQTIKLRLGVGNDGTGGSTGMLIDEVQAQVCRGNVR